ncbi:MAG: nucleotide exchange factor GrpE [Candidatus Sumerlaeia bacterium]|nr:nucleotide exchange factor GrpE [Candidatus Sumerlaeia bacterium]
MSEAETTPNGADQARVLDAELAPEQPAPRDAMQEKLLRLAADLENLRRRTARDIESARQRERENILRGVLEVVDNFERALSAQGAEGNQWLEGMEAIHGQLVGVLRRHGAEPINCAGATFDPNQHEALAAIPKPDAVDGAIIEVVQNGYKFADGSILRPARVVVVRNG